MTDTGEPWVPEPPDPEEPPLTDWSVPAWVSVSARTADEARWRIKHVIRYLNDVLSEDSVLGVYNPIVQRADDDDPRPA